MLVRNTKQLARLSSRKSTSFRIPFKICSNMTTASTPAIKYLFELAQEKEKKDCLTSDSSIQEISEIMSKVTSLELGLSESQQKGVSFHLERYGVKRPVKYYSIYQGEKFDISIFCIPSNSVIPLHDHPNMTVFSKLLYGDLHVLSYDWIDEAYSEKREGVVKLVRNNTISANDVSPLVLFPNSGGNLHEFRAITDCAILDLLTPPYNETDKFCSYYKLDPDRTRSLKSAGLPSLRHNEAILDQTGNIQGKNENIDNKVRNRTTKEIEEKAENEIQLQDQGEVLSPEGRLLAAPNGLAYLKWCPEPVLNRIFSYKYRGFKVA